ncbi:enoyl-[acyl-carrier-protein] reductase [NADH] [Philodulcilactobacillus myokoensis]|uniref:Enoyl-[acyl-carrier-protein] reductase [NADH] n=1 Tax=Philodulcilactobacillus myokoensis TaxID=2929573 RepID=A0A9W6B037_9LACO|nr:enoyl-ACP reductase FabI [Philodulcilactobacillus myokoensis]GLB46480.1 enoyl-[acyl-carrier-protein] reductase [NADH] [Philodulcilactobacillus myokoensis]
MSGILDGKKIVVMGAANRRSIAWGCVKAIKKQGAQVILTYQNDRIKKMLSRIDDDDPKIECDVAEDANIKKAFDEIHDQFGNIDGVVHAIAYADKKTLTSGLHSVERKGYNLAQDISAYSFIAVSRYASQIMNPGGSIATLTYMGSTRAIPNYNMMGVAKAALESSVRYLAAELGKAKDIRVNAISAGAIRTLSVTGIKHHKQLLDMSKARTVDGKSVTIDEVGNAMSFILSDLASGVTGDTIFVDKGVHLIA